MDGLLIREQNYKIMLDIYIYINDFLSTEKLFIYLNKTIGSYFDLSRPQKWFKGSQGVHRSSLILQGKTKQEKDTIYY